MPEAGLSTTAVQPLFAGPSLAARLEGALAGELHAFAEVGEALGDGPPAETLSVAGGVALFFGAGSPVNQAAGLGFAGEVTRADIEALEAFCRERGVEPLVVAAPHAHPSLFRRLAARGYAVAAFENALVRPLPPVGELPAPDPAIEVRPVSAEDRELYARMVVDGFAAPGVTPSAAERRLGRASTLRAHARLFLAFVGGEPAGTGELVMRDGLALLTGDTTMPAFRRRGVQRALQLHRLRVAAEAGCELATSDARLGSASQRNMERAGFRVAYTRVELAPVRRHVVTGGTPG